jgi:hypothetical protein
MADTYLQYEDADNMIMARWHGGAYIEFGHVDDSGEWHATDVINVWDYADDEATIPFTPAAMAECIEEHLKEDEDDAEDEDDDDDDDVDFEPSPDPYWMND